MSDGADRTIPATPRRREAARLSGAMPTAALPGWIATVGTAIFLLPAWTRATVPEAIEFTRRSIVAAVAAGSPADLASGGIAREAVLPASLLLPTAAVIVVAGGVGLLVRFLLDGSAWRLGRAAPALRRINPLAGFARIVSPATALVMLDAVIGLAVLAAAAAFSIGPLLALVSGGDVRDPAEVFAVAQRSLVPLAATAAVLAFCQWGLARHRFERRMRMTPQEFADESRSLRADPKIHLLRRR
jgi:flagellar biosynthetic protein FlhB